MIKLHNVRFPFQSGADDVEDYSDDDSTMTTEEPVC